MNSHTPPPRDDEELPDEAALSGLYARLPKDAPSPALDAAVLAAAARATPAAAPMPVPVAHPRRRGRWLAGLASAAVLVLAAGVAWQVRDAQPLAIRRETGTSPAPVAARKPDASTDGAAGYALHAPPAAASRQAVMQQAAPAPASMLRMAPMMPAERRIPPASRADVAAPAAVMAALAPDDRIGHIRYLLDHGQRDEALRELRAFRQQHPTYDIPQDLRDLNP